MFSFLQQLVPKRREDLDVDEDAYADSSAMPAFVPPAPLVKPPLTEDEIAEQEREAAEAEEREAAERAEAERLEQEALDEEKRRAEERLVERQARAHALLEERAAERQRREEAHRAATATTLVAVPDLETESEFESESESESAFESEPVAALEAHVVEDDAPSIEEDGEQVYEPAHFEDHVEHHDDDDEAFAFVPPAPEAEHVADDFAFVPPAPPVDQHVASDEPVETDTLTEHAVTDVPEEHLEPVAFEEHLEPVAREEHVEPVALGEHVDDAKSVGVVDDPEPEVAALEPVVQSEPERQHVHAHVGSPQPAPTSAPVSVPEAVERYTWPATLLHHEHAMQYGEGARRNLISMIVELNDAKLARVLHDALYEERADGLRPEVLLALQRSYNGEDLRETYERFVRIGSEREREIAAEGIRSLDEGHA
jgi:hypothetical protein